MQTTSTNTSLEAVPFLLTGQPHTRLSRREREVCELIANGLNIAASARHLGITEDTVKRHTFNVFQKTGLSSRTEIAVYRLRAQMEEMRRSGTVYIFGGRTMNFTPDAIHALCQQFGPQLHVPAGIDGGKLLYAISGCETSFGKNCTPRHENAYDHGGFYGDNSPVQEMLLKQYGSAGACSYGPWQLLLVNAPSYSPDQLTNHPDIACRATVDYINKFVFGFRQAQTLEQIAEIYNSGSIRKQPSEGVLKYVADLQQYYRSA